MDNLRSDLVHPEQIPADRELLVVCIAGAISKHMTVSLYPKEVLAAAEYIVDRYTAPIKQEVKQEPVASIYISSSGEREFDDWNCALPIGRHELYTAPVKPENELNAIDRAHFAGKQEGITESEAFKRRKIMSTYNVLMTHQQFIEVQANSAQEASNKAYDEYVDGKHEADSYPEFTCDECDRIDDDEEQDDE